MTNSSKVTFCFCCHQVPNLEHISHSPFWISAKKKKQRKNTDSERLLKNKETLIFIYDPSAANSEWNTMTVTWTCLESLRNHHVCQQGDKSTTTRTTKRDKQKQTKTNNYKQVTDVLLHWSWRTLTHNNEFFSVFFNLLIVLKITTPGQIAYKFD